MELTLRKYDSDTTIFALSGSLLADHEGAQLFTAFEQAVSDGAPNVILDLSALKHVNSSGLGIFIRMLTRARTQGGDVVITGINSGVSNLFTITKLHTIFRFAPTVEEAVALIRKS
jgi:anti-sigma B factor antagonist